MNNTNSTSESFPAHYRNIVPTQNNDTKSLKQKRIEETTSIYKKQKCDDNGAYVNITSGYYQGKSQSINENTGANASVIAKATKYTYKDTKQQGEAIKTCANGNMIEYNLDKDGVPQGKATLTCSISNKRQFAYKNRVLDFERYTHTASNNYIYFTFKDGLPQGEATKTIGSNQSTIKFSFIDGKAQGGATESCFDGTKIEFSFIDGVAQGEAIEKRRNGNVIKFTYEAGVAQGSATETDINGDVKEFNYENGKRQGQVIQKKSCDILSSFVDDDTRKIEPINI